jgi:hypothetical protein
MFSGIVWAENLNAQTGGAPAPAASPTTLLNFLGIPQGFHRLRDATANRWGNNPGMERTDPLKPIADPANLQSPNPAIQTAAKIKQAQDLAPQKIKAIKYLATVGCGCYPNVKEALVAALDDCSEEVRYEAAVALCRAAGNPCKQCEKNGCCNAAVMNKLQELAYGQDDQCCPKEPSARVRAAAQSALQACQRMHPEVGAPTIMPQGAPGGLPGGEPPHTLQPRQERPANAPKPLIPEPPTEPTPAPVKPTPTPVKPTSASAQPTLAPAKPIPAPVKPTSASAQPTLAPAQPTLAPAQPTSVPAQPAPTPAELTLAPARSSSSPAETSDYTEVSDIHTVATVGHQP